jgi:uncharacterized RDD family membrane protein YckC
MPTVPEAAPDHATRQWWLGENGQVKGPYGEPFICVSLKTGKLRPETLACPVGAQEWRTVADWPELRAIGASIAPPPPPLPKRPTGSVVYAEFWDRVRAAVIDNLILFLAVLLGGHLFAALRGEEGLSDATTSLLDLMAFWVYFAAFESSGFQATLGKKAFGIQVTDMNGRRLSFGRATARQLGKVFSFAILLFGFVMAAFTEKKQALHDMLANCLVVYRDPPGGLRAFSKDVRPAN